MMNPTYLTFDVIDFRSLFQAFSNDVVYPDALLQMYWDTAINYISNVGNFGSLQGTSRQYALNLMTAHLAQLNVLINSGQTPYVMDNATIDKINIGLLPPPVKSQWQWWLNTTPYGAQLLSLLQTRSAAGFYIGGSPQVAAFRNSAGLVWV